MHRNLTGVMTGGQGHLLGGHDTRWIARLVPVTTSQVTADGVGPPLAFDWALQAVAQQPAGGGDGGRTALRWASLNAVIVIAGVFSVITLSTTAALVIFCRKKNIIFAFQHSDDEGSAGGGQEESFELHDIGVVIETHPSHTAENASTAREGCTTDVSDCEPDDDEADDDDVINDERRAFLTLGDSDTAVTVCER